MKVLSVNVARPRTEAWNGEMVTTGIFKEPVAGAVQVNHLTIAGDVQIDLRYHGGLHKAVYGYPWEHYRGWQDFLSSQFSYGQFGENLTVEGMLETDVFLGDRYQVGSAVLQVTQPRVPCYKLALKMKMPAFPKWFLKSGKLGFYFKVVQEGSLQAGDAIVRIHREPDPISIHQLWLTTYGGQFDPELAGRLLTRDDLAGEWTKPLLEKSTSV